MIFRFRIFGDPPALPGRCKADRGFSPKQNSAGFGGCARRLPVSVKNEHNDPMKDKVVVIIARRIIEQTHAIIQWIYLQNCDTIANIHLESW